MSFYSPIDRLMEQSTRPKGTGAEYMTELSKKPGFKQAEVEDRDLQALLALPKMAREDFLRELKDRPATQPREKVLAGDRPYHEEYTLPGGTNYREILLQHPRPKFEGVPGHFGGEPDILASIRAKDRVGPNGEKILHIEEIQSDWHKQGSKRGYQPKGVDLNKEADKAKMQHTLLSQKLNEARQSSDAIDRNLASDQPIYQNPEVRERQKQAQIRHNESIMDLMPQVMKAEEAHRVARETARSAVPEAPFKKNWHELALKRMIHHAAEKGYDQLHITPGETQAERWGAEGDGAKGFHDLYDKQLPQFLNKFGKQYGSQVQQATIPGHPDNTDAVALRMGYTPRQWHDWTPEERAIEVKKIDAANVTPLHRFDITPEMREDVLKHGMPLYAKGGEVDQGEGLRKFLEPSAEKRRMYHGTRHHPRGADEPYTMGDVMDFHKMTEDQWGKAKNREALMDQYSAHRKESMDMDKLRSKGGFSALTSGEREMSFVSPDTEFANDYAGDNKQADKMSGAVYPVHVQVKNPFDYENPSHVRAVAKLLKPTSNKWAMHYGKSPEQIINRLSSGAWEYIEDPDVRAAAQKLGHDAMYMTEHGVKNLGVFNPNAIKSATGNRGTYDINDPHMNHAEGGSIEGDVPRETVKAYKLFKVKAKHPGKLFPLFVNPNTPVDMNKWVDAEAGEISANGKVKSNIGDLAFRPGWHAGDLPVATHIGEKTEEQKAETQRIKDLRKMAEEKLGGDKRANLLAKKLHPFPEWVNTPSHRNPNHVWAEVEMPNDVDWQTEAIKRGHNDKGNFIANEAHITDQLPKGGHYRYKTNPNMAGNWMIGGGMKVNRVLKDAEVDAINKAAGVSDLPRREPFNPKEFGFAKGGVVSRETIKPVAHGIIKERVTVSPNLDAMQYELMSAKHFTKKVK